jgi:hypothetical protein
MVKYESHEEYLVNESHHEYSQKANVTVGYAGRKMVNGVETDIPCVVVGVEKKVKKDTLSSIDLIPKKIGGIHTDVVEFPRMYAATTCTGGGGGGCYPHDIKFRPLVGGISAIQFGSTACTLGAIVRDDTDKELVALSNNHCAGLLYDPAYSVPTYGSLDVTGIDMLQPSPSDGGVYSDFYGQTKRAVALQFGTGAGASNLVDGTVSSIDVGDSEYLIMELGTGPFPFAGKAEYSVGEAVYKSGRTTGNTPFPVTTIISKNAVVNVDYSGGLGGDNNLATFVNQLMCSAASRFTQGGDSGSVILIRTLGRYRIVGLHFASDAAGTLGIANPIEDVSTLLQVSWWNGDVVVSWTSDPFITVNGHLYRRVEVTIDPITHISGT